MTRWLSHLLIISLLVSDLQSLIFLVYRKQNKNQQQQHIASLNHPPASMDDVNSIADKSYSPHVWQLPDNDLTVFLHNVALQPAPRRDIFGQVRTAAVSQRCTKPLIPLLMHSYKYFTGKNLPSRRPGSTLAARPRMGVCY